MEFYSNKSTCNTVIISVSNFLASFAIKPEAGDGRSSFQQFLDNCGPDNCFQRYQLLHVCWPLQVCGLCRCVVLV